MARKEYESDRIYRSVNSATIVERARNWSAANPIRWTIIQLRYRAKKKGIPFDLDADFLMSIMPADGLCPILLVPLTMPCQGERKGCPTDDAISIDRHKPELGYVRGNVAIMSVKANRMKNDCVDAEAFERMADHIRRFSGR